MSEEYAQLTRFWPRGHLLEGELKAKTRKAVLVDETWIPASQIEGHEIKGDRAKLIVSDWFFKQLTHPIVDEGQSPASNESVQKTKPGTSSVGDLLANAARHEKQTRKFVTPALGRRIGEGRLKVQQKTTEKLDSQPDRRAAYAVSEEQG